MAPDSLALELLALVVTVAAAVVAGFFGKAAIRVVALVLSVSGVVVTSLVWVNRQIDEYPTWASLSGSNTDAVAAAPVAAPHGAGGDILTFTVAGKKSGMTLPMYAYTPPGYRTDTATTYPVVEALHGYPGGPLQWLNKLGVRKILDTEIRAGRMAPTIVLFPYQTPKPTIDTECTNIVHGPQAETFLTQDVPAFARAHLRVRGGPGTWGLIGFSAGAYCATDLLLRHPDEYYAGASLSGYADPGIPVGNGTEHTTYNATWRFAHLPIPAVALYLACARTDRGALKGTQALAHDAKAPMSVTTSYVNGGGHNAETWIAMEAPAFDWLSSWLGRPADAK